MSVCILSADDDDDHSTLNTLAFNRNISKYIELCQDNPIDIDKNKLDRGFSAKKISFKDINFHKTSNIIKNDQINSNFDLDSNIASYSDVSNIDELSGSVADMFFEFDSNNIALNSFEFDPTSNILDRLETTLHDYSEMSNNLLNNTGFSEVFPNSSSDEEVNQKYDEFPNEAYTDLIILVTKYKLSNAARNAIISFFNKHANYSTSPLPKNIKHRKFFMNNMKSNLSYMKTKVLDHDNTEYFLYHMLLISCIKNILEIPDISQNFVLEYEELHKITEVYITFNIIYKYLFCFLLIYFYLF